MTLGTAPELQPATYAEDEALAGEVFTAFLARANVIAARRALVEDAPWELELRRNLDDPRLASDAARTIYESRLAELLAQGWQRGHHALLAAACKVFNWTAERQRLAGFGPAGATLNSALEQQAMFKLQPQPEPAVQQQLIARLRDSRQPGTRELVTYAPALETLLARFPDWLALMAPLPTAVHWQELHRQVPGWRRKLTFRFSPAAKPGSKRAANVAYMSLAVLVGAARLAFHFYDSGNAPVGSSKPPLSAEAEANKLIDIGNQQINDGDFAVAISTFSTAIRRDPDNAMAYADRAIAHYWNEDYRQAGIDADKAAALDQSNAVVYRVRGLLSMREDRYSDALADFTRSLQLQPDHPFTHLQRALAYNADKQYREARIDAEAAIRLQPDLTGAYALLARQYRAQGDLPHAQAQADALLKVAHRPKEYVAAAQILAMLQQSRQALDALQRGIAATPDVSLYTFRARLLPKSDTAGRQAALQAALDLDPHANEALLLRGELEFDTGNYKAAVATYDSALADVTAAAHRLPYLLLGRGVAYARLGRAAEAAQDFGAARAGGDRKTMTYNRVCWYLATHNVALETALDNCEKGLASNARSQATLDSKGFVLLRLGRYQEAIASYDAALAQQKDSSESLYGRGLAKRRAGDRRSGEADLRAAIAIDANVSQRFADYGIGS